VTKDIAYPKKYFGLFFGEGNKDKKFLFKLAELDKFHYHSKNWRFTTDHASGGSPQTVLEKCYRRIQGYSYDLVLCFIDLDKLKQDFPDNWTTKKSELEQKHAFHNIKIIWQIDNLEEELTRTIGESFGKHKLNIIARKKIDIFINSDIYRRILSTIRQREKELDEIINTI